MIAMKEAIQIAKTSLLALYADTPPIDVRLEEIERSEDAEEWLVTLGFRSFAFDPSKPLPRMNDLFGTAYAPPRQLKVIRIDARTGGVIAIKNRAA